MLTSLLFVSGRNETVTALVKGKGGDLFTLKGANAQTGSLKLIYNGSRPSVTCKQGGKVVPCDPAVHGYNPMKLQGAIIMGNESSQGCRGEAFTRARSHTLCHDPIIVARLYVFSLLHFFGLGTHRYGRGQQPRQSR